MASRASKDVVGKDHHLRRVGQHAAQSVVTPQCHLPRTVAAERRYLFLALSLLLLLTTWSALSNSAEGEFVGVIGISGAIDGISSRYFARAMEEAISEGAELVVVSLDTPGGWLVSTREMVEVILGSAVPVAVHVSPPGARAGSAGTFITAAANFAVMAPGTNIGAASPVGAGGEDIPTTLAKKINQDTRAFIRSIAEQRGRNTEALEKTVTEARSYSATEALQMGIVDYVASDIKELLSQVEGQVTNTSAGTVTVGVDGLPVRNLKQSILERFLGILSNPNLTFVLLAIGGLGIWSEMTTPGFIGPGVVGVIALLLAFVGMGNLPVNWIAVGLVLFAMLLFYLELMVAGFGVFGIGGLVSFSLGGILLFGDLFETPDIPAIGFQVNRWLIGTMTTVVGISVLFLVFAARTSGGTETGYIPVAKRGLVGQKGQALSDLTPSGTVNLNDEEWTATSEANASITRGDVVRVIGVYGDVLRVQKESAEDEQSEESEE